MTNHGGCAILNEMITYPDRKETRKKFQKTGMPWWSNEKANLLLVPIFSAMDELSYTPLWKSVFYKVH